MASIAGRNALNFLSPPNFGGRGWERKSMALALRGDPTLSGSPRLGRLCFVAGKTQLFVGIIMVALPVGETAPGPHAALGPWHPEVQQPKALLVVQSAWITEVFVPAWRKWPVSQI